jgi:hypothetical protein
MTDLNGKITMAARHVDDGPGIVEEQTAIQKIAPLRTRAVDPDQGTARMRPTFAL